MMKEALINTSNPMPLNRGGNASLRILQELAEALSNALAAISISRSPDVRRGVNFYEEVRRFEIDLIEEALRLTQGHQRRAAKLLEMKVTTLNAKIKFYNIEVRNAAQRPTLRHNQRRQFDNTPMDEIDEGAKQHFSI